MKATTVYLYKARRAGMFIAGGHKQGTVVSPSTVDGAQAQHSVVKTTEE